jgi:hypothetical protein
MVVVSAFAAYFFLFAPPNDPLTVFLPYQLAIVSTAVMATYGWTSGKGSLVVLGALALLILLVAGFTHFPMSVAACEEWVAGGRFRNGAF